MQALRDDNKELRELVKKHEGTIVSIQEKLHVIEANQLKEIEIKLSDKMKRFPTQVDPKGVIGRNTINLNDNYNSAYYQSQTK